MVIRKYLQFKLILIINNKDAQTFAGYAFHANACIKKQVDQEEVSAKKDRCKIYSDL